MKNTNLTNQQEKSKFSKYQRFMFVWLGQQFSLLGSEVVQFVITWWITVTTQNPIYLSLSMFLTFLPRVVLGPVIGVIIDRSNRKFIIAFSDFMQALGTFSLIVLLGFGYQNIAMILAFITIRSICQAIHQPAMDSIITVMVPKEKMSRFMGISQLFRSLISIVSPVIAATLMAFWSMQQMLWIDIGTFLIAVIFLLFTKFPKTLTTSRKQKISLSQHTKEHQDKSAETSFFTEMKEGFAIIKAVPGFLSVILVCTFGNMLLTPFNTMSSLFINVTHGGTEKDMALVSAALNFGMVLGAIIVSIKKQWHHKAKTMLGAIILIFIGITFMALTPQGNFFIMSAFALLIAIGLPAFSAMYMGIMQTKIPQEKMGRVSSIASMLMNCVLPIGYIASGPIAKSVGVVELFLGVGIMGIVMVIIMGLFSDINKIDQKEEETQEDKGDVEDDVEDDIEEIVIETQPELSMQESASNSTQIPSH